MNIKTLVLLLAVGCGSTEPLPTDYQPAPMTSCYYCTSVTLGCEMKSPPTCYCWDEPGGSEPCRSGGVTDAGVPYCLGPFSPTCGKGTP